MRVCMWVLGDHRHPSPFYLLSVTAQAGFGRVACAVGAQRGPEFSFMPCCHCLEIVAVCGQGARILILHQALQIAWPVLSLWSVLLSHKTWRDEVCTNIQGLLVVFPAVKPQQ